MNFKTVLTESLAMKVCMLFVGFFYFFKYLPKSLVQNQVFEGGKSSCFSAWYCISLVNV